MHKKKQYFQRLPFSDYLVFLAIGWENVILQGVSLWKQWWTISEKTIFSLLVFKETPLV